MRSWRMEGRAALSVSVSTLGFSFWIRLSISLELSEFWFSHSLQVKEFVRKVGSQKGDKWRLFEHIPTNTTYKSLNKAKEAGLIAPMAPVNVD